LGGFWVAVPGSAYGAVAGEGLVRGPWLDGPAALVGAAPGWMGHWSAITRISLIRSSGRALEFGCCGAYSVPLTSENLPRNEAKRVVSPVKEKTAPVMACI